MKTILAWISTIMLIGLFYTLTCWIIPGFADFSSDGFSFKFVGIVHLALFVVISGATGIAYLINKK